MKRMRSKAAQEVLIIAGLLILLQLLLLGLESFIFLAVERTAFSDSMAAMVSMIVLTALFLAVAKKRRLTLSVFPERFSKWYLIASAAALILLLLAPSNYTGDCRAVLLLIYGSVVTPIYEEIIFRGYIWNRLKNVFNEEWKVYVVTTILFALWHFGYVSSIAFRVSGGLMTVMLWKVVTGLCFGIVLGAVRMKTKNCYSTMLLHGVMNLFGR